MKKRWMTRVLSVVLLTTVLGRAQVVDYAAAVAKAREAGDLGAVNRLCMEWIRKMPGDEKPRIILGQVYAKAGMIDRAVEQFELAGEANPLSPVPRCELGQLFLVRGMADQALKEFGQALRVQAGYLPAVLGNVRARLGKGEYGQALTEAQQASASAQGSATAHALVGECFWQLEAHDKAELAFAKALSMDAGDVDALFGHARALEAGGNVEAARKCWQQFLEGESLGARATRVRNGWVVLSLKLLPKACRGYPAWSPDGRRIMYGYGRLGVVDVQSDEVVALSAPGDEKLFAHDWSPDGRSLACRRLMPDKRAAVFLYEMNPDGALQLMADNAIGEAAMGRFSPDGTKVALSGGSIVRGGRRIPVGLAVFDLHTGMDALVPWNHKKRTGRNHAAWGPDSRTLVIHAYGRPNTNDRQLFILTADGSTPPLQITDNGAMNLSPGIAPDGRSVVFETAGKGGGTISLVCADGASEPVILARGSGPSWSPDGRCLAYDTPKGIALAQLGGLGSCPIRVAIEREGTALAAVITAQKGDVQKVSLRWEAYGADSVRLGAATVSSEPVELKPGERVEWPVVLSPEQAESAVTVKVTVLNEHGVGTVRLVDVGP
ncbi:MAG: PD40 domain-containing protein [Lentisphaeria bacterium]|nr:PD40 domain-containing protein [Lentisphaeria bacterium]